MRVICILVLVVIALASVIEAASNGRKGQVRYLNSMTQFGKAQFSAASPSIVVFDQVDSMTAYAALNAQPWNFTSKFTGKIVAQSDETDLDSDSYATVFTCQTGNRKLKNKLIYDTSRSTGPNVALLRTVNLAQYDYPVSVLNGTNELFTRVAYCTASSYIQVSPGSYEFDWYVDNFKRCCNRNLTATTLSGGSTYTYYTTPSGSMLVNDGSSSTSVRSILEELTSAAEVVPASEVKEERAVAEVAPKTMKIGKSSKRRRAARRASKA